MNKILSDYLESTDFEDPLYNDGEHKFHKYIFDFIAPKNGVLNLGATKVSLLGRQAPIESKEQNLDWSMRPGLFET